MSARLSLALLALLTVAIYSRSVYAPFVFDDTAAIQGAPQVNGHAPVSVTSARSVLTLSYRLNYWFDASPYWFHVVNVALHLINGLLVFGIARKLFGSTNGDKRYL